MTTAEKQQLLREQKKQQGELMLQKRRIALEQQREAQIQKRRQAEALAQQQRQAIADRLATKKRKADEIADEIAAKRHRATEAAQQQQRKAIADRLATKKRQADEIADSITAKRRRVDEAAAHQRQAIADRLAVAKKCNNAAGAASAKNPSSSSSSSSSAPPLYNWSEEQCARIRKRSYLGPRGYTVWTDAFITAQERAAAAALMKFQPIALDPRRAPPKAVTLGSFGDQKCFFPKAQALAVFGLPDKYYLPYHRFLAGAAASMRRPTDLFCKPMYANQLPILAQCLRALRAQYTKNKGVAGIVLQAGCGVGKTLMSIAMAVVALPRLTAGLLTEAEIDDLNLVLRPPPSDESMTTPAPGAVLVLVYKDFLLNQWIKNITDSCPGARIGSIVGKTHNVQGCNFVIAMVQTMYSKTYGPEAFAQFQTVIIDEAHCVCTDKYRMALVPLVAPFILALSATVQRPGGMEEVLFRYVGPIAYRSPVEPTRFLVTVRLVHFTLFEDPEYSRVDMNANGEMDYTSTLIRVSMHPARLDAGADVLIRFTTEDPDRQILVLSTLRAPLTELQARIDAWNDEQESADMRLTYGFYIGGMPQEQLDESTTRHIIFATYSMAAEALDIPSLDAVFMYNSKADITQSVGRAMRFMNNHKTVMELVDGHQVFQSQLYRKRMPEYRNRGFHVYKASYRALASAMPCVFANAIDAWKPVFLPRGFMQCSDADDNDDDSSPNCGGGVFGNDDDTDDDENQ